MGRYFDRMVTISSKLFSIISGAVFRGLYGD